MRIATVIVYPVKGCRGIALPHADVLAAGLRHDRRFMVVGEDERFLTQRRHPRLSLIATSIAEETLTLDAAAGNVTVALTPRGARRRVVVWDDAVEAVDAGERASAFLSDHLGVRCRLVHMPENVVRPVEAPYGRPGDRVSFADGYPVLLASLASLADLNARLEAAGESAVPMDRFRPNLVVDGGEPYEEDRHRRVHIGAATFRMPKRCARCEVTTVDPSTASVGKEPLRTLARYRAEENHVYFSQNLVPEFPAGQLAGVVGVGDRVVYAPEGAST